MVHERYDGIGTVPVPFFVMVLASIVPGYYVCFYCYLLGAVSITVMYPNSP